MDVTGRAAAKLDSAGRITLPKRFLETGEFDAEGRPKRLEPLWLTPGLDTCLWLLDQVEYRRILRRLRITDIGDARLRVTQRRFLERCERLRPDRQGRVLLPQAHQSYARLKPQGQVLVLGLGRRIELWDPETKEAFERSLEAAGEGFDWQDHLEAVLRRGEEEA